MENQTEINIHYCRFCDGVCKQIFDDIPPPHYSKIECLNPKCNFWMWIGKPKNEDKRKPSIKLRKLIPNNLQNIC